jgi:predicted metalloprotease with PDZ domain
MRHFKFKVSQESPASTAGLQVGDMIVEFGTLKSDNFTSLTLLATVAESSKNENIRVKVIRNGELKTLLLKPKVWSGKRIVLLENQETTSKLKMNFFFYRSRSSGLPCPASRIQT